MKVQLIESDLEGDFYDIHDCPLARAMKRMGHRHVAVGGWNVDFDVHKRVKILNFQELHPKMKKPVVIELDIHL